MNLPFGSSIVRGYADILNLLATGLNSLFQRSVFPRVAVLCPITAGGDNKGYAKALTRLLIEKTGHEGKGVVIECAPEQDITKHIATSLGFTYQGITDGCCVYMLNGEDE